MKTTIFIVLAILCLNFSAKAQEKIKGRVVDAQNQQPLAGAVIKIKTPFRTVISNNEGYFELNLPKGTYELQVQYLAYGIKELLLQLPQNEPLLLQLNANENNLEEVQVVSTGYQALPKERATGSFVLIDSTLLNRRVGANILDRLDGVTSGLLTTKSTLAGVEDKLMIRGRSTLFAEEEPLIILDNFPYEGSINNINPSDIKTITILKDAAAASIWGARAGNGVIVITTHQGRYETKTQVDFNSNLTLRAKPDLYQAPWMANHQWIEIEQFLFNQGAYNSTLNNGYGTISPAVEIMHQTKRGLISTADSLERINQLKAADIRKEMLDRLYRIGINQQHNLSIKGGGANHTYYLSAGHDQNRGNQLVDSYQRTTITANQMYKLFSGRLVLNANIGFTNSNTKGNNQYYRNPGSPYERLADENGEMLAVRNGLRLNYVDTVGKGLLLDWHYRPLEELESRSNNNIKHLNLSLSATVNLVDALKMTLLYQRQEQNTLRNVFYDENSFYARDLINRYSVINTQTGLVTRPLPLGGIRDNSHSELQANNGRLLLSYNKDFAKHHQLNIIAGSEVRETTVYAFGQRLYGFNSELYTHTNPAIDFTKEYPMYYNPNLSARLDLQQSASYSVDRNISYFTNLSYVFMGRYTLSASARKDQSNLFGVKPNQKGVPLWSLGLLWDIAAEPFYRVPWLQQLKLRSSYGYSGNVSKTLSAYLTATASGTNVYGAPFNVIVNPPNPSLRWERVRIANLATDFSMFNRKLEGSVELYAKQGLDLFGESPLAPQTGVLTFNGNTANTSTRGLDISLRSLNLSGAITWRTDFQFSKVKDKVTRYLVANANNGALVTNPGAYPQVGFPYFAVFAYTYAGLDAVGDPQLYIDGQASKNYAAAINTNNRANVKFMGSSVPTTFGNVRNSLSYKNVELSLNITYRLGYVFRRNSLNNQSIYTTTGFTNSTDYNQRWMKPGDESFTQVPALRYPNIAARSNAYTYSDILIETADNIRLQDIRLDYRINAGRNRGRAVNLYCYFNNIGYLWKANKLGLDPDNPRPEMGMISFPRTIAFGLKTNL